MAAGLGFKDFQAGSILTASDVNAYLASQANMVFASAAARDAAITSPQEGMIAVLKDSDGVFQYNGTAWIQDSGIAIYTSFTPTVSGWTLGNGTVESYYKVLGKMVHYYGRCTIGTTTTLGGVGTSFTVTLPETSRFGGASLQMGIGQFRDTSAGTNVFAQTAFTSTTTMRVEWAYVGAGTNYVARAQWDNDATIAEPFAIANGDFVTWDIVYERA